MFCKAGKMSEKTFCELIISILLCRVHKKQSMIFFGPANTGKSTLINWIASLYFEYEVGSWKSPASVNAYSPFVFAELINTHLYISHEGLFENLAFVQYLKELMEGGKYCKAEAKYQDAVLLPRKPIFMAMNARSPDDAFKFVPHEQPNFAVRAHFVNLYKPITSFIPKEHCVLFAETANEFKVYMAKFYSQESDLNLDLSSYKKYL